MVRELDSRFGLIFFLLILPVYYGSRTVGATARPRAGSRTTSSSGISNGAIWALIALGYTLVYGIIELINFAHGDVFMLGTFVAFAL